MFDVKRSILFETVNMITCANVVEMLTVRSADTPTCCDSLVHGTLKCVSG